MCSVCVVYVYMCVSVTHFEDDTDTLLLHTRILEGVHVHKLKREQLPKKEVYIYNSYTAS